MLSFPGKRVTALALLFGELLSSCGRPYGWQVAHQPLPLSTTDTPSRVSVVQAVTRPLACPTAANARFLPVLKPRPTPQGTLCCCIHKATHRIYLYHTQNGYQAWFKVGQHAHFASQPLPVYVVPGYSMPQFLSETPEIQRRKIALIVGPSKEPTTLHQGLPRGTYVQIGGCVARELVAPLTLGQALATGSVPTTVSLLPERFLFPAVALPTRLHLADSLQMFSFLPQNHAPFHSDDASVAYAPCPTAAVRNKPPKREPIPAVAYAPCPTATVRNKPPKRGPTPAVAYAPFPTATVRNKPPKRGPTPETACAVASEASLPRNALARVEPTYISHEGHRVNFVSQESDPGYATIDENAPVGFRRKLHNVRVCCAPGYSVAALSTCDAVAAKRLLRVTLPRAGCAGWVYIGPWGLLGGSKKTDPSEACKRLAQELLTNTNKQEADILLDVAWVDLCTTAEQQCKPEQLLELLQALRTLQRNQSLATQDLSDYLTLALAQTSHSWAADHLVTSAGRTEMRKAYFRQQLSQAELPFSIEQGPFVSLITEGQWRPYAIAALARALKQTAPNSPSATYFLDFLKCHSLSPKTVTHVLCYTTAETTNNLFSDWIGQLAAQIALPHAKAKLGKSVRFLPLAALFAHTTPATTEALRAFTNWLSDWPAAPADQAHPWFQPLQRVVQLLVDYRVDGSTAATIFRTLRETPASPHGWERIAHRQILEATFTDVQTDTVQQLAKKISQQAEGMHFAGDAQALLQSHEALQAAYQRPSTLLTSCTLPIREWQQAHVTQFGIALLGRVNTEETNRSRKSQRQEKLETARKADPSYQLPPVDDRPAHAVPEAELIAVVQRAVELAHGYPPRDVQRLALLALLHPAPQQGRLVQVNTGEGKSCIVAMLAAVHALQGQPVDVLTTSTELVDPEVDRQKSFFEMLNLTVNHNSPITSKNEQEREEHLQEVYSSNVVYGTPLNFQGDLLRTEFSGRDTRNNRRFGVAIVDEVDSMLYDERTHATRLSTPLPSMDQLLLPLGAIWQRVDFFHRHLIQKDGHNFLVTGDFSVSSDPLQPTLTLLSQEPLEENLLPVEDPAELIWEQTHAYMQHALAGLKGSDQQAWQAHQELQRKDAQAQRECAYWQGKLDRCKQKIAEYNRTTLTKVCTGITVGIAVLGGSATVKHPKLKKQKAKHGEYEKKLSDATKIAEATAAELRASSFTKQCNRLLIPRHLEQFSNRMLGSWIHQALEARFVHKKNFHYTVEADKIVPIDYRHTGVLERNTIWSQGLHQFLQMKEGVPVSPEQVATNFIANASFFKRYGHALYGLTGTLGNASTRAFLQTTYGVDGVVIPPYKACKIAGNATSSYRCKELTPRLAATTEAWYAAICDTTLCHVRQGRPVLVICKYIEQVDYLHAALTKRLGKAAARKLFRYTGQTTFKKRSMDVGEVLLATNIAGRGTDLIPTPAAETVGGMHVCLTFLPDNYRIELQNAGRTARQGKKGSVQLVMHETMGRSLSALRKARDTQEAAAAKEAAKEVEALWVEDRLFSRFCALESELLPKASDAEKQVQYACILAEWRSLQERELTPAALQQWFTDSMPQRIEAGVLNYTSQFPEARKKDPAFEAEIKYLKEELRTYLQNQYGVLCAQRTTEVKEAFCRRLLAEKYPNDLIDCFRSGRPFQPKGSSWATQYEWGAYERMALQERWGFWFAELKEQHKTLELSKALAAFDQFAQTIRSDAAKDQLIKNPCYYVQKGNHALDYIGDRDRAIAAYDRAIALDPTYSLTARYNKARALLSSAKDRTNQEHKQAQKEYKRAIALDPTYSRYNQAPGRLSAKDQTDQERKQAQKELEEAGRLLGYIYAPRLVAFMGLLRLSTQTPHTSLMDHVAHHVDILTQLSHHVDAALHALRKAQKKDVAVVLTPQRVDDALKHASGDHSQAIHESLTNGLSTFFVLSLKDPHAVRDRIILGVLAGVQLIGGAAVLFYTANPLLGTNLLMDGLSDLVQCIRSAIQGSSMSWGTYWIHKGLSWAVTLTCAGPAAIKEACADLCHTARGVFADLSSKWPSLLAKNVPKQAQQAGNQVIQKALEAVPRNFSDHGTELLLDEMKKAVKDTFINQVLQSAAQKVVQPIRACIEWIVRDCIVSHEIGKLLQSCPQIAKGIALDRQRKDNFWQRAFLHKGQELLQERDSPLLEAFRTSVESVTAHHIDRMNDAYKKAYKEKTAAADKEKTAAADKEQKLPFTLSGRTWLDLLGLGEMGATLLMEANAFFSSFSAALLEYDEALDQDAQNQEAFAARKQTILAQIQKEKVDTNPPPSEVSTQVKAAPLTPNYRSDLQVDLDEKVCPKTSAGVDAQQPNYAKLVDQQGGKASAHTTYVPSSIETLQAAFQELLTNQLMHCIEQRLLQATARQAITRTTRALVNENDRKLRDLKFKLYRKRITLYNLGEVISNQRQPIVVDTAAGEKLTPLAKDILQRLEVGKRAGVECLGPLSQIVECPLAVYSEGTYAFTQGRNWSSPPIGLLHIRTAEGGHWSSQGEPWTDELKQTSGKDCLFEAVYAKADRSILEKKKIRSAQDLRNATVQSLLQRPEQADALLTCCKQLESLNPDLTLKGGYFSQWLNPDFYRAIRCGDTAKIEELKALHNEIDIAIAKLVVITGVGVGVSLTPAGIVGALAASSAVSGLLDPELRHALWEGDWEKGAKRMVDHLPVVGSGKQAAEAYQNGHHKMACLYGILALCETGAVVKGVKEIKAVSKLPKFESGKPGAEKWLGGAGGCAKQGVVARVPVIEHIKDILNNPKSFKGTSVKNAMMEIDKHMPAGWKRDIIKKGRGVRWYDGKGNEIKMNYGYKEAIPGGKGHTGPYIRVTQNGTKGELIHLEGNPDL